MKPVFTFFFFVAFAFGAKAQIKNTSWIGVFNVPMEMDLVLSISEETMDLFVEGSNAPVESMKYKISGDTLLIEKISGQSPCALGTTGLYQIKLEEKKLRIVPLKDDCDMRANCWPVEGLTKMD